MSHDAPWTGSLLLLSSVLQAEASQNALRWHWRQLPSDELAPGIVVACRQLVSGRLEMRLAIQGTDVDAWVRRRRGLERPLGLVGWTRTDQAIDGTLRSFYAEPIEDSEIRWTSYRMRLRQPLPAPEVTEEVSHA